MTKLPYLLLLACAVLFACGPAEPNSAESAEGEPSGQSAASTEKNFETEENARETANAAPGAPVASPGKASINVRLTAPDPSYKLLIDSVYQTSDRYLVMAKLTHDADAMVAQVLTPMTAEVTFPGPKLPTRTYLINETPAKFPQLQEISSKKVLADKLADAEQVYPE